MPRQLSIPRLWVWSRRQMQKEIIKTTQYVWKNSDIFNHKEVNPTEFVLRGNFKHFTQAYKHKGIIHHYSCLSNSKTRHVRLWSNTSCGYDLMFSSFAPNSDKKGFVQDMVYLNTLNDLTNSTNSFIWKCQWFVCTCLMKH